jgi:hypothetical protein
MNVRVGIGVAIRPNKYSGGPNKRAAAQVAF